MANAKPAVKSAQESAVDRSKAKSENFKRLASKRVTKTLNSMSGITQLANKNSYTYDAMQVTLILNALKKAVNDVEAAFTSSKEAKSAFTL